MAPQMMKMGGPVQQVRTGHARPGCIARNGAVCVCGGWSPASVCSLRDVVGAGMPCPHARSAASPRCPPSLRRCRPSSCVRWRRASNASRGLQSSFQPVPHPHGSTRTPPQARNFAVMTGVNAGVVAFMKRVRGGKEDVQNQLVGERWMSA